MRDAAGQALSRASLVVAVAVQLAVLYSPSAGGAVGVAGIDKVVHIAVFGAVAVTGVRAGLPVRWLAGALLVHAVLSEVVQAAFLAHRSGDPRDIAADVLGVALGLAAAGVRPRAWPRGPVRDRMVG